jgi:hypothetical protein
MKKAISLCVLCVLLIGGNCLAADQMWFGAAHDRDWFNLNNWNADPGPAGPVPGPADKAKVDYVWANPGPIIADGDAHVNQLYVAESSGGLPGAQTCTVDSGSIEINLETVLGYGNTDDGSLIVNDGTVNCDQHLFVGFNPGSTGRLIINGGTVNVSQMFGLGWNGGAGIAELYGGLLHTEQWTFAAAGSTALMTIDGGEWIQNHFWVNEIQAQVDAGKIITTLPGYHIDVSWDPVLEQTHVKAIPEPVSIVLFGLGALLLRKRTA